MAIGLLIIGDEILSGRRADKHLVHAIEILAERGLRLASAHYCGDEPARLTAWLRASFTTDDLVFSFGGIGATPDDHTRQCAAAARGEHLALHIDAEREIRGRFGDQTTPHRLRMGEFPQSAQIIPNPYNRIPGFSVDHHHFLPGFPEMAWPMMEWVLDTRYAALHHAQSWVEEAVTVMDASEGQLVALMVQLEAQFGVTVFSLPTLKGADGRSQLELGAKASDAKAVRAAMDAMRAELVRRQIAFSPLPQK